MKTDDDIYVNVERLSKFLVTRRNDRNAIYGCIKNGPQVTAAIFFRSGDLVIYSMVCHYRARTALKCLTVRLDYILCVKEVHFYTVSI